MKNISSNAKNQNTELSEKHTFTVAIIRIICNCIADVIIEVCKIRFKDTERDAEETEEETEAEG